MNIGTVIALIKSLAPKVDTEVIEQAVSDWLDEHPGATTTVEDGSITEAKLAEDVLNQLEEIDTVKNALSLKYTKPPTGIPASDLASGVLDEWEMIADYTVSQNSESVSITTDTNGQPFELKNMYVRVSFGIPTTGSNDYVASSIIMKSNDDVIKSQQLTSLRCQSGTAKAYFDYFLMMIYQFFVMFCKAGNGFVNSQNAQMTSFPNAETNYTVKSICGFMLSQYNASSTLIPEGTNIKVYGIRK